MLPRLVVLTLSILFSWNTSIAQIIVNEAVTSNSQYEDADGDTPDWLELYNPSNEAINLTGWYLSDKSDKPQKWQFPNTALKAGEYLTVWASNKDIKETQFPRTLISQWEIWRYITPNGSVNNQWTTLGYNDDDWLFGPSGFGYADGDDATTVSPGTPSIYIRKKFNISNINELETLVLDIDYDDAFVAYLNGVEVARSNISENRPEFDDFSDVDHEAELYSGGKAEQFNIETDMVEEGENVLAIQAHNVSYTSSDLTVIPFLTAFFSRETNSGITPPDILNHSARSFHTNFKLSDNEEIVLSDASGTEVSRMTLGTLPPNVSLGILPGTNQTRFYRLTTPGTENGNEGFIGFLEDNLIFSKNGGMTDKFDLTISGTNNDIIRYTTDSSLPDINSEVYNGPISIEKNTVIRARTFRNDFLPSKTQTHAYLVGVNHQIPIASFVTEPKNLFGDEEGIYVLGPGSFPDFPFFGSNIWEDWERPVNFQLIENDGSGFKMDMGAKIFGGWSRALAQRSLAFFARGQYGNSELDYPLFSSNPYDKYQAFVLRNSGNDFSVTGIRDVILTSLMDGSGIETQAFKSVATYINGEYWGMYNMREKVNEHFLASRFGIDTETIDLIGPGGELIHGSDEDFLSMMDFLQFNNLDNEVNYEIIKDQVDIDNFIIYQVAQIYFDNTDWPGNNIKLWKTKNGKWRWILYDTDFGFGLWNVNNYTNNTLGFALQPNGPAWPNPPSSTLLFRRLMANTAFLNQFVNQFADELNSRFKSNNVTNHIDKIKDIVISEIPNQANRWGFTLQSFNQKINDMKQFALQRNNRMKSIILSQLGLSNYHKLTLNIEDADRGYIQVNSLTITEETWKGDYFQEVPIAVTAVARPGYEFVKWQGASLSTNPRLNINMKEALSLTAVFRPTDEVPVVVINEINYNSNENFDSGDWIELYNPSGTAIDLTDWRIADGEVEDKQYSFTPGTLLPANQYLILTRDKHKFDLVYSDIHAQEKELNFGLSSNGDAIKLFDNSGALRDSVTYSSVLPWPEDANGNGPTLELIDPASDNALPENWASEKVKGSPGRNNVEDNDPIPEEEVIDKVTLYPNPFSDMVNIDIGLTKTTEVKVVLYADTGARIRQLFQRQLIPGNYTISEDLGALTPGVYYVEVTKGGEVEVMKWVKI